MPLDYRSHNYIILMLSASNVSVKRNCKEDTSLSGKINYKKTSQNLQTRESKLQLPEQWIYKWRH